MIEMVNKIMKLISLFYCSDYKLAYSQLHVARATCHVQLDIG